MSEVLTGPTPSPATNELLALCEAVSRGAQDRAGELQQKVAARQGETTQQKGLFLQAINTQNEDYMTTFAEEIGNICTQFDAYAAALDQMARGLKQPDLLPAAHQALAEASINLRLAMMHYENQVLATGPSRFQPVNLIQNLGRAFLEGRIPADTWQSTCRDWAAFHTKAIEEIDASPHKSDPGIPERRRACGKAVEAMQKLEKVTTAADLESGMALWAEAHEGLEAAGRAFDDHAFFSGPTPSKQANLVLSLARGVLERRFEVSALRTAVEEMHQQVSQGLLDFHNLTRQPTDEPRLLEEFPKMLAALEGLDDALQDILAWLEEAGQAEPDKLRHSLAEFEKSALALHQATQNIESYNQSSGKVPCPSCQHYNAPGSRFCAGCQRSLPQMAGGEGFGSGPGTLQLMETDGEALATGGPLITENMKTLNNACVALDNGEMTEEAFLELIDSMEADCQQTEMGLAELRPPEIPPEASDEEAAKAQEFVDLAEDALALLSVGVQEIMAGLEHFRAYAHNRKPEDSLEGARLYFEGIQKLYQVQKVDQAFQEALASAPAPAESQADQDDEDDDGDEDESSGPPEEGEEAPAEDTNLA